MNIDAAARTLVDARRRGLAVPKDSIDIRSVDDAYAVQTAIAALHGSDCIGIKLGATLQGALDTLSLEQTFHGELHAAWHHDSGGDVALPVGRPVTVETEFVVELAEDIVADGKPTDAARVRATTASVRPGLELVGPRFDMTLPGNGRHLIADAAGNTATVIGAAVPSDVWESLDLSNHAAALSIDGEQVADGHSGMSLAGNPFAMVAWLLDQPAFAERGLKAGELIFCGSCTGMLPVSISQHLNADFGALGFVEANLVAPV